MSKDEKHKALIDAVKQFLTNNHYPLEDMWPDEDILEVLRNQQPPMHVLAASSYILDCDKKPSQWQNRKGKKPNKPQPSSNNSKNIQKVRQGGRGENVQRQNVTNTNSNKRQNENSSPTQKVQPIENKETVNKQKDTVEKNVQSKQTDNQNQTVHTEKRDTNQTNSGSYSQGRGNYNDNRRGHGGRGRGRGRGRRDYNSGEYTYSNKTRNGEDSTQNDSDSNKEVTNNNNGIPVEQQSKSNEQPKSENNTARPRNDRKPYKSSWQPKKITNEAQSKTQHSNPQSSNEIPLREDKNPVLDKSIQSINTQSSTQPSKNNSKTANEFQGNKLDTSLPVQKTVILPQGLMMYNQENPVKFGAPPKLPAEESNPKKTSENIFSVNTNKVQLTKENQNKPSNQLPNTHENVFPQQGFSVPQYPMHMQTPNPNMTHDPNQLGFQYTGLTYHNPHNVPPQLISHYYNEIDHSLPFYDGQFAYQGYHHPSPLLASDMSEHMPYKNEESEQGDFVEGGDGENARQVNPMGHMMVPPTGPLGIMVGLQHQSPYNTQSPVPTMHGPPQFNQMFHPSFPPSYSMNSLAPTYPYGASNPPGPQMNFQNYMPRPMIGQKMYGTNQNTPLNGPAHPEDDSLQKVLPGMSPNNYNMQQGRFKPTQPLDSNSNGPLMVGRPQNQRQHPSPQFGNKNTRQQGIPYNQHNRDSGAGRGMHYTGPQNKHPRKDERGHILKDQQENNNQSVKQGREHNEQSQEQGQQNTQSSNLQSKSGPRPNIDDHSTQNYDASNPYKGYNGYPYLPFQGYHGPVPPPYINSKTPQYFHQPHIPHDTEANRGGPSQTNVEAQAPQ